MDQNSKSSSPSSPSLSPSRRESEWDGPWWKHPYTTYLWIVLALFAFLGLMGYLAVENDWIPTR
jgi:hypothetical protein